MNIPNALIIGVQKSATTWLSQCLSQHTEIFMHPKEIHFFDKDSNYRKGKEWYASFFKKADNEKIICEKTGSYFWTTCGEVSNEPKDKPERIRHIIPDAKLIVLLRNPVSRAISAWNHNMRAGNIPFGYELEKIFSPSHHEVVTKHGILSRGLYYQQLERLWQVFPKEQTLVLFQDFDVISDPNYGLAKVCNFLGVDSEFNFEAVQETANRFETTYLGTWITSISPIWAKKICTRIDKNILTRFPLKPLEYPKPSDSLKESLFGYYEEDLRKLSEVIGPIPESWKHPNGMF